MFTSTGHKIKLYDNQNRFKFCFRALNLFLILLIFLYVTPHASEKGNYLNRIAEPVQKLQKLRDTILESIQKIRNGLMTGEMAARKIESYPSITNLSELVSITPSNKFIKRVQNDGRPISLKKGVTLAKLRRQIIQGATYYVSAHSLAKRGFATFNLKAIRSAEKLIIFGDKSWKQSKSMVSVGEMLPW